MSLLGKIAKIGRNLIKSALPFVPGPVGAVAKIATAAGIGGAAVKIATPAIRAGGTSLIPLAGGAAARVLPGAGKIGGAIAGAAGGVLKKGGVGRVIAGTIAGEAIYDAAGNLIGHRKKYRRMNYCNMKAARRATRRIKGARKELQRIEKALPHRTVHRSSKTCR